MTKLLGRSRDHGGITAIVLGQMGSGKTTFLLSKLALPLLETKERLIWRGGPFCQWGYLPPERINLILSPLYQYTWIDRRRKREVNLEDLGIEYSFVYEAEDILWKIEPGRLNVVYVDDDGFIELLEILNSRPDIEWISIFHDEIQKLAPSNVEGDQWRRNKRLADALAETRKNYVSFYAAAQELADIDYRINRKWMTRVYLKGARPPRCSMVYRHVPLHLAMGEAIIDYGSQFVKTSFKPLKRHLQLVVRLHEAGVAPLTKVSISAVIETQRNPFSCDIDEAPPSSLINKGRGEGDG